PARPVRGLRAVAQARLGVDLLRRLRDHRFVRRDAAGGNGALRLGAALDHAAFDEQPVDANTASHATTPSADETSGTAAPWSRIRPMEQITTLGCCFQPARCDRNR